MDRTNKKSIKDLESQSGDEFREIFDQLPIGILFYDKKGITVNANNSALKMLGFPRLDDVLGYNLFDNHYINGKKDELLKEGIIRFQAPLNLEKIKDFGLYPNKKGILFLDYNISVIDSGFLAQIQDITELKKTEEKLMQKHDVLETVLESSEGPIFSVDCNYRYTSFNLQHAQVMKNLFGADIEIGGNILDYHTNPEDRKNAKLSVDKAFNGEIVNIESFTGDTPQNRHYFSIFHTPIQDSKGKVTGVAVYAHDITERKKAEEALKESEEKYRNLFMNMTEEVHFWKLVHNSEGNIKTWELVDANPPTLKTWGKKLEEIKGRTTDEIFGSGSTEHYMSIVQKVMKEGVSYSYEDYFPNLDKHFKFTTVPLGNYFITTGADITEIKKSQEKLKEAHDNLEQKVEERTIEIEEAYQAIKENEFKLKDAIKELERSNKELQSFAYITSHDLQEPLRSIASYAQLLQRRYEGQIDQDADDFLDFMVAGATRMKDQIQGLLDYSRVGTQGRVFKDFNAEEALDDALTNLKSSIEECHVEVISDPLPVIHADESQISRVFQNLIGNALKFRKKDVQPKIHIKAQKEGYEYIFSVQDNGIGIEPEYSGRIFEVFKRLHAIGEYEGTGIGLAIVKRIIERHHGRIWVKSEFGVGSTFYFTIPILEI